MTKWDKSPVLWDGPKDNFFTAMIQQSWNRCTEAGLTREHPLKIRRINGSSFRKLTEENRELISIAEPLFEILLSGSCGADFLVSLISPQGCILKVSGTNDMIKEFRKFNIQEGAYLMEKDLGTTAIGLALLEYKPAQVFGNQHYLKAFWDLSCTAVPLISDGDRLIGCIAICKKDVNRASMDLSASIATAHAIMKQLQAHQTLMQLQAANHFNEAIIDSAIDGFMVIDQGAYITHINRKGAEIFGLDYDCAIGTHVSEIVRSRPVVMDIFQTGVGWTDREFIFETKRGPVQMIKSAIPVKDDQGHILYIIETFRELEKAHHYAYNVTKPAMHFTFEDIIGHSPAISETVQLAKRIANTDSTVLLQGETGTGKELFAQAIHYASHRSNRPYVAINCGSIPRDLLESELFGYAQGAFTGASKYGKAGKFEFAAGGTILLDEVGEMPLDMQVKLLRVLQERGFMRLGGNQFIPADVRIIAATNRQLQEEVTKGNFREDLFYRLNVISIQLPPLRKRTQDIELLIRHFTEKIALRLKEPPCRINNEAMDLLLRYSWPGNVRELENAIERAATICSGSWIQPRDLPDTIFSFPAAALAETIPSIPLKSFPSTNLRGLEMEIIYRVLAQNLGNKSAAARQLGISRSALYSKLQTEKLTETKEAV